MTIIQKYQLAIMGMPFVIGILLILVGILLRKLRRRDLDRKIDRGRRTQRRMEQHPKRIGGPE